MAATRRQPPLQIFQDPAHRCRCLRATHTRGLWISDRRVFGPPHPPTATAELLPWPVAPEDAPRLQLPSPKRPGREGPQHRQPSSALGASLRYRRTCEEDAASSSKAVAFHDRPESPPFLQFHQPGSPVRQGEYGRPGPSTENGRLSCLRTPGEGWSQAFPHRLCSAP